MELKSTRRVVTGHDTAGKAVVLFDGSAMPRQRSAGGNAVTMLWVTSETPVELSDNRDRGGITAEDVIAAGVVVDHVRFDLLEFLAVEVAEPA